MPKGARRKGDTTNNKAKRARVAATAGVDSVGVHQNGLSASSSSSSSEARPDQHEGPIAPAASPPVSISDGLANVGNDTGSSSVPLENSAVIMEEEAEAVRADDYEEEDQDEGSRLLRLTRKRESEVSVVSKKQYGAAVRAECLRLLREKMAVPGMNKTQAISELCLKPYNFNSATIYKWAKEEKAAANGEAKVDGRQANSAFERAVLQRLFRQTLDELTIDLDLGKASTR